MAHPHVPARMRPTWAGVAQAYDESFAQLCVGTSDALVALANAHAPAGRVLDVGTGTGRMAAAFLTAGFDVCGVDADPGMIATARRRLPEVELSVDALPALDLPDDVYDVVIANFVVNHVPRPRAAVREMLRVTRPDGLLLLTVWPSSPVGELNALWNRVIADAEVTPPPAVRLDPAEDFERSAGGIHRLLVDSGGRDVETSEVRWRWRIARTDLWRGVEAGIATVGAAYLAQKELGRRAMRASFDALTSGADLSFDSRAVLGAATK